MKRLLPQSEVQDPKQLSDVKSATNCWTKRSPVKKNEKEDIKAFDSDGGGEEESDDTIDDFISSEDVSQTKQRTFSKSTDDTTTLDSKVLGLPSMLSTRYTRTIGLPSNASVTKVSSDYSESSSVKSSSGSATVGSLQQTSLELDSSEGSTRDENGTAASIVGGAVASGGLTQIDGGGKECKGASGNEAASGCGGGGGGSSRGLEQPSLDLSFDESSESSSQKKDGGGEGKSTMCDEREKDRPSFGEVVEWHLTLECSSEDEKRSTMAAADGNGKQSNSFHDDSKVTSACINPFNEELRDTPKADDSTFTPPAKRKKRSRERKRESHHQGRCTDLSTPVEGEELATPITPKRLFPKSPSEVTEKREKEKRRKSRKTKAERDKRKFENVEVIDLTQDEGIDFVKVAGVTGTKADNVIIKGKSPKQGKFLPPHTENTDHHPHFINSSNLHVNEPDSDITFCEEDSGSYTGSPFYLPPTPGREDVNSILTRKSIAFSD